jgi:protein ImuA
MRTDKAATIEALRTRIAAIEKRPVLAEEAVFRGAGSALDLVAAPAGLLHEVVADQQRDAGAVLGFTFGLARPLLSPLRPAILYLQLNTDAQEIGFPYAIGFSRFGIDPDQVVFARIETITEFLWTMEEAIACHAVAAVIADVATHHKELDFTVSRRLSLRTDAAGTSTFLIRYGTGREASASKLRWRVMPRLSGELRFDPQAPGPPRFGVTLEKGRLSGMPQLEGQSFELDWVDNHGFVLAAGRTDRSVPRRSPAPSRPQPALLGDRLSAAS